MTSVAALCAAIVGCAVEPPPPQPPPSVVERASTVIDSSPCLCPIESMFEAPEVSELCLAACSFCGDDVCNHGETRQSCPIDCGPLTICGNDVCEAGEPTSCPSDCAPPPTPCGDGICKNAFSVTSAQAQARYAWGQFCHDHPGTSAGGSPRPGTAYLTDQSAATYNGANATLRRFLFPVYYDFISAGAWNLPDGSGTNCSVLPTSAINATLCVAGCVRTPVCGNGVCESGETPSSCTADCGPVCGNGVCEAGETPSSCTADCGPVCGNGVCEAGETRLSCPADCPLRRCGNGICEVGEVATCPQDCGGQCLIPICAVEQ